MLTASRLSKALNESSKVKCFYHSADLDGHCSGALVLSKYPDAEMIGINYGDEFPWDDIHEGDEVFMVDFSLEDPKDMEKLAKKCDLIWIDHHETAIDKNKDLDVDGLQEVGKAGCELTAEYLGLPVSEGIKLLGRYDVWDDKDKDYWEEEILPFHYGMGRFDTRPEESMELWQELFEDKADFISKTIESGKLILEYETVQNAAYVRAYGFDADFQGYKAIVSNRGMTGSGLFDSLWDPEKYDLMVTFCKSEKGWKVSLYTTKDDVDCGELAKKNGGGGHKQAAGYTTEECPF